MTPVTHELHFSGELLERGFWLYVWEITTREGASLYYVGRTGDSSSNNSQSPFNRMGQHLGFNKRSNVLRRWLNNRRIDPAKCSFRLVAHGPILAEAKTQDEHRRRRDRIAAMEKALADAMVIAGYEVMNKINCRIDVDAKVFAGVQAAFSIHFQKMKLGVNA